MEIEFDNFPYLESERFILREVREGDYIAIYEIYSNEDAVKYQQIGTMQTIEQAQQSVKNFQNGFRNKKFIRWCIAKKENDEVVGLITLHSFDIWNSKAEIGFMLNKKYWQQNIMCEVAKKIIEFAFEVIKLHRIEASIHPDNIGSIKLSEKLGFKREGLKKESAYNRRNFEYEDRLIFGLIKSYYFE